MHLIKHLINTQNIRIWLIVIGVVFFGLVSGCGKRKPPLPPAEKVSQRVILTGFQRGERVNLSWQMPARNAPDGSLNNINRVEIYRLAENINSPVNITEEDFSARSTLIYTQPISDRDFAQKVLTYQDVLDFAGQRARLRYSIRFINDSNQRAAFSNFLLIEPVARIAQAPSDLKLQSGQDEITITWSAPNANIDQSVPANVFGYNIYRSGKGESDFVLLNKSSVNDKTFSDSTFEFDQTYRYLVRAVSINTNGEPVESADSEIVTIKATDRFAPSPPEAVTIAAAPNVISLFFVANSESDLAGYRIYRTQNSALPKTDWDLLTANLITSNTFQDRTVKSGVMYFYYIVAVDKSGNISQTSEVVSETAP